jgi:putative tricarboxylic transport membrane protein
MTTRIAKGEAAVAAAVLALAAFVIFGAGRVPVAGMIGQLGPRFVPYLVGAGLAALGLALAWAAAHGGWPSEDDEETVPADWRALAWLGAGLFLNLVLIGPLGFATAVTVMFTLVARGFASTRPLRDAAIGCAIALAAWICFEKVLGIQVGAGYLEAAIERVVLAPLGLG